MASFYKFLLAKWGLVVENRLSLVFNDFHYQRVKLNSIH